MPDVSVIIPTWNRAELLEKAIYTVLAQSLPPREVLVCDDGSTDESQRVVTAIRDNRVRWIPGERSGRPAVPRNRGIAESKGEWLAFLDNDDEWMPNKLEKQLQHADLLGCRAVCSNATRIAPGKGSQGEYLSVTGTRFCFNDLLMVNHVICSSAAVHRSVLATTGGFPEDPGLKALEDYALWLRVAAVTDFAYCPEPLVRYRDDAANSVRQECVEVWQQRTSVFSDFLAWGERADISGVYLSNVRLRQFQDKIHKSLSVASRSVKKMVAALRT